MEKFLVRTNKPTNEAYLQFGFTVTADMRPQCVVCAEVLANNSMKPYLSIIHLSIWWCGRAPTAMNLLWEGGPSL